MRAPQRAAIGPSLGALLACLLAACSAPPPASAPPEEPAATPPTQAKASVLIISEPSQAAVAIDGRDTGKKTPCTLTGLDAGRKLNVEVTLDGYEKSQSDVTLAPGENRLPIPPLKKLGANLASGMAATPAPGNSVGTIEATSSDPTAKFFIGGVEIGTGSLSIRVVSSEPGAALRVEATQPSGGAVSVRAGGGAPAATESPRGTPQEEPEGRPPDSPNLPAWISLGNLRVSSSDPDAKLFVDGALIGSGSASVKVTPGRHSIRATNARGDSKEWSVAVEPRAVVSKHFEFPAGDPGAIGTDGGVGKLFFVIKPWAEVYINDQLIGTTPFAAKEFPGGSYRVRLVNKDLGAMKTFTVKVEAGQTTKVAQSMAADE